MVQAKQVHRYADTLDRMAMFRTIGVYTLSIRSRVSILSVYVHTCVYFQHCSDGLHVQMELTRPR